MTTPNNTPMQDGFAFPADARLQIDKRLREFVATDNVDLVSVRPERQQAAKQQIVHPVKATIPVRTAAPTSIAESSAISIDVPSKFHYYDFKDLYIKPFKVFHLSKLAKAHETGSLQSIVEAVSTVISSSTTADTNLAARLTTADFNAVLYWLRLNSFGKKTMRFESVCTNPEHLHEVENKTKPPESLKIITTYSESIMETTWLTEVPDPAVYHVMHAGQRIELSPETIMHSLEFMDHPRWLDEEFQYLARRGVLLTLPNATLDERCAIIASLDTDSAIILDEFLEMMDSYGVVENVTTKCPECGASGAIQVAVDAPCFLSPEF